MTIKVSGITDELRRIPGVGPSIARDLRDLGIRRIAALRRRSAERMYDRINALRGVRQDPCLLYVFRCAVYYASTSQPDPELLKWWNWKDRTEPLIQARAGVRSRKAAH